MTKQPHFSPAAIKFFRGLAKHNDRTWFAAHKSIYEDEVRAPMIALVTALCDDLRKFAVDCVPARPEKNIYRIYRDTRFSKDKTPYKTHIAAHFQHQKLPKNMGGGFYFQVSHEGVMVAGGIYMPGPDQLAAVREAIAKDHKSFRKLCADKTLVRQLSTLQGDALRRPPKGYDLDHPAADLLKMKQWHFWRELDPKLATQPALRKAIADRFKLMAPMVNWINDVCVAALGSEDELIPKRPDPMF